MNVSVGADMGDSVDMMEKQIEEYTKNNSIPLQTEGDIGAGNVKYAGDSSPVMNTTPGRISVFLMIYVRTSGISANYSLKRNL